MIGYVNITNLSGMGMVHRLTQKQLQILSSQKKYQFSLQIFSKVPAFLLVTDIAGLVQGASEGKVWLMF